MQQLNRIELKRNVSGNLIISRTIHKSTNPVLFNQSTLSTVLKSLLVFESLDGSQNPKLI